MKASWLGEKMKNGYRIFDSDTHVGPYMEVLQKYLTESEKTRLAGWEQLWIGHDWAARFGMPPEPADFGRGASHTREQVRAFRASVELLLTYHDATYERMKTYLNTLTAEDLARQLDEPQYQPLPTVAVRLVSV